MRAVVRRLMATTILAALFVLPAPAALVPAAAPIAIGGPAGGLSIPAGSIASFTNILFGACNSLSWGYQLDGAPNQVVATFPGGCGSGSGSSLAIGPFATLMTLRVFLTDNHCNITYYSDGTPVDHVIVQGSNPYTLRFADAGFFCERKTTTANAFTGCNFCVNLAILDSPLTPSGTSSSASEGKPLTTTLANFSDADTNATASEYSATIAWGDGSSSAGTITGSAGSFTVSGGHTFAEEGTKAVSVTIDDTDNPSNSATAQSTIIVGDAALTASPACAATSLMSYSGRTATFADAASPFGTASDFTAKINWGDGASAAGTVSSVGGGTYAVDGSHTFPSTGRFTVSTTIIDLGGSMATTSCTTVGFSFAPGGGAFVIGSLHASVGGAVVFWGPHWTQANSLDADNGTRSFKGFAEHPATPTCGDRWTTDPGNSTPPPSTPLPTYMGVIVTTSTSKAGSVLSGDTVHIVVVKTDPGYAPSVGHAGTGTVVAVVC